ncbi:hypothetical protein PFISCL1PPCAC_13314, partial [Pristionchus fissidentatus]
LLSPPPTSNFVFFLLFMSVQSTSHTEATTPTIKVVRYSIIAARDSIATVLMLKEEERRLQEGVTGNQRRAVGTTTRTSAQPLAASV